MESKHHLISVLFPFAQVYMLTSTYHFAIKYFPIKLIVYVIVVKNLIHSHLKMLNNFKFDAERSYLSPLENSHFSVTKIITGD
jgi:hypothetical protein